jgi:hypothetical protein
LFVFILIICLCALFFGLSFEKINFSQFEFQGVNLSANPKIVLSIDRLIVNDENKSEDENDQKKTLKNLRAAFLALALTDRIAIKRFDANGTQASVLYENGEFNVSSQYGYARFTLGWLEGAGAAFDLIEARWTKGELSMQANGFISPITGRFFVDARYQSPYITGSFSAWGDDRRALLRVNDARFQIEEYEGELSGLAEVDLINRQGSFEGNARALGISGALRASYAGDLASFTLLNAEAASLELLARALPVDPIAKSWIHGKIVAEGFKANRFAMDLNLTTLRPSIISLALDATARNADIRFNPDLPPAFAEEVKVSIGKGVLKIVADNADYEGQKANAKVVIDHLEVESGKTLELTIDANALFNESMRDLIAAYGANSAITQLSGENRASFALQTSLNDPDDLHFQARLLTRNGEIDLAGLKIKYGDADIAIEDSNIKINRFEPIAPNVSFISVGGLIEAKEKKFALDLDLRKANGVAARFNRLKTKLTGEWDEKGARMRLGDLATEFSFIGDRKEIKASDLQRYKNYLPLFELLDLKSGTLNGVEENGAAIADFAIDIGAPILYKDEKPVTKIGGRFTSDNNGSYSLKMLDNAFALEANDDFTRATISGLELDVEALVDFVKRKQAKLNADGPSENGGRKAFVFGDKSGVRFKGRLLKSDWFSYYQEGERFEGQIKKNEAMIRVTRDRSDFTLRGEKIDSEWVKELSGVKMSGGEWDFSAYASLNSKDIYGVIRIKNATIEEAKLFSNVIALINALPSLAQFRSPGFTSDGFMINEGVIELYYANDVLYFNAARFLGTHTDVLAQGSVNIDSGEVDVYAAVQSVKSLSSLVSKVPIIGYLLIGDGEKIENIMHITGALENPSVQTTLAKDFVFYPVGIFRRALTLPVKLFE